MKLRSTAKASISRFVAAIKHMTPHADAVRCRKCKAWSLPFTTVVEQSGWTLCNECHAHPDQSLKDFSVIDWMFRRIRFLGKPGDPLYDERHHRTIDDED